MCLFRSLCLALSNTVLTTSSMYVTCPVRSYNVVLIDTNISSRFLPTVLPLSRYAQPLYPPPLEHPLTSTQDEIEIVQASLVGSILSNLLLILGMCFLLGGLRYREQVSQRLTLPISLFFSPTNPCTQIYNSTVTQMSACLLSLSVSSLLLPVCLVDLDDTSTYV